MITCERKSPWESEKNKGSSKETREKELGKGHEESENKEFIIRKSPKSGTVNRENEMGKRNGLQ